MSVISRAVVPITLILIALLLVPVAAAAQPERERERQRLQEEAEKEKEKKERGWLRWRNRPSFQFGDLRLDLRLKMQFDFRHFDPDVDEDEFDLRVRRGGINGEFSDHLEFQIERDLKETHEGGKWRDVFVNWRTFRQAEVMAGRFKVPFGREQLIGISDVDFAYRTLVSSTIPPARDTGVMVHGRFLRRGLTYEVGVFEDDGDNGSLEEPQFSATGNPPNMGESVAGRVTVTPLRPLGDAFQTLRVGAAYGTVDVPAGLNSLRGRSVHGTAAFFPPVFVQGRRQRVGAEISYTPGPVGLAAEWMRAREQRLNQSIRNEDLSDFLTTGWYASATWLVTGEDKADFSRPEDALFDGGIGAVELAARVESLRFESEEQSGTAVRNSRADHLLGNEDFVWTVGVNWFPNRWVRATINAIREEFEDPFPRRLPVAGETVYWSGVFRLQLVF